MDHTAERTGDPRRRGSNATAGALVTRPVPTPAGFDDRLRRRWELFAPVLQATVLEAAERGAALLFEEADETSAPDRRRMSFTAARELSALQGDLRTRVQAALERLFVDPRPLARAWQAQTGAFSLQQLSERLLRSMEGPLAAAHRRLHGTGGGDPARRARALAEQLAGLLAESLQADHLSAHARNVASALYARRLETVLPNLAGDYALPDATRSAPAALAPVVPAASAPPPTDLPKTVLDALTRLQLAALEGTPPADLAAATQALVEASAAPYDADAVRSATTVLRAEQRRLAALIDDPRVPRALADVLQRLLPVIGRSRLLAGATDPALHRLLSTLVRGTHDLTGDDRDPRGDLLEDLCGDLLARYTGDSDDLVELVEDASTTLATTNRRLAEVRRRASERRLTDRRREAARDAAARVTRRLSARPDLASFLEIGWQPSLLQAHLRYGPASTSWRRMLDLGLGLLSADVEGLREMRPALADALSLANPDATDVERILDRLEVAIGEGVDPTILPTGDGELLPSADPTPLEDRWAWLLPDGRRRWLLVQPDAGQGQILLSDPLARKLEWMSAEEFRALVDAGQARPLDGDVMLERWAATG